jgi:hypothetical protein
MKGNRFSIASQMFSLGSYLSVFNFVASVFSKLSLGKFWAIFSHKASFGLGSKLSN